MEELWIFQKLLQTVNSKFVHAVNKMSEWSSMSIKDQGHFLTLAQGHSDFEIKTCFFLRNYWAIWNQISNESFLGI